MGLFTKDIHTLADLFAHQLKDVYYAEHRITKALPKMIAKATSPSLQQGFRDASRARPSTRSSGSTTCSRCSA